MGRAKKKKAKGPTLAVSAPRVRAAVQRVDHTAQMRRLDDEHNELRVVAANARDAHLSAAAAPPPPSSAASSSSSSSSSEASSRPAWMDADLGDADALAQLDEANEYEDEEALAEQRRELLRESRERLLLERQVKELGASKLRGRDRREFRQQHDEERGLYARKRAKVPMKMLIGINRKQAKVDKQKRVLDGALGLLVQGSSAQENRKKGKEKSSGGLDIGVGKRERGGMIHVSNTIQKRIKGGGRSKGWS
jgi:hypothetical protein